MNEIVDIGANLTHDTFDDDLTEVISRAHQAGVTRLIVTGTSLDASQSALNLADRFPGRLYATAGIHPHHADDYDAETAAAISDLVTHQNAVAVGECGLDYFRNYSSQKSQLAAFESQLQIAAIVRKPVFLHQRDAHDPFVGLLREHLPEIPGGVAHCFTGTDKELEEYLSLGLHIGITGWICDERRGQDLRQAIRNLPLDRVLLETDAPYLLPRDLSEKPRGRRNEPSLLPHILGVTARYMQQPAETVAKAATRNTERLFGLETGASGSA